MKTLHLVLFEGIDWLHRLVADRFGGQNVVDPI